MRLLHFADVHLGMTNFGSRDVHTGMHERVLDFLDAMDTLVEVAESVPFDLIMFAGDAFKTRSPNPTLVNLFAERMQRLGDVAPVLAVLGNHDRQKHGKKHSISLLSELKCKHGITVAEDVSHYKYGCASVVTLPWLYDVPIDDVYDAIDNVCDELSDDVPCVLAGHCTAESAMVHAYTFMSGMLQSKAAEAVYMLGTFDAFDYTALGHIHKHQALGEFDNVVYCGSLERIDWGERDDPKGFVIADVDVGRADWEFCDTGSRRMVQLDVDWADLDSLHDADIEDAIVRVTVRTAKDRRSGRVGNAVREMLPGTYHLLDSVDVVSEARARRYDNVQRVGSLLPIDLVEQYLEDRHPNDPDAVDVLYNAAADLMDEVDERRMS